MDTTELLKKVRKLEIKTRDLSSHIFSGEYHSAFKGRGMSFSEVRAYMPGDDIRSIDWNVTARTGTPHIKIFEEERELTVMLLIDKSRSVYFGSGDTLKNQLITEVAAVLAFSAISNNDKVGLILFSEEVELYIPPKKGKTHILRIIREMLDAEPAGRKTRLDEGLRFFRRVIKKRSICFVIGDFLCTDYEIPLKVAAQRHDLVGLMIYDKIERELPDMGFLKLTDAETGGEILLDSSDERVREEYRQRFLIWKENAREQFRRSGADLIPLCADEPYIPALLTFFKKRSRS